MSKPVLASVILANGIRRLQDEGIPDAPRDARKLMAFMLGIDTARLTIDMPDMLLVPQIKTFALLVSRRVSGEPMSHILGLRAFYENHFEVTADVLDPRPETEELVRAALQERFTTVLDLGTGSGCIILSLLAARPSANGVGVDASSAALGVAARNADKLGLSNRCELFASDWFASVSGSFDLIVSNPPYIALDEMAGLAPELSYEPRMALTDEGDGLSCYRIISAAADAHLNAGGWLMLEIGPTQGAAVLDLVNKAGFINTGIRADLDGRDRVIVGQKPL